MDKQRRENSSEVLPLGQYDKVIIAFSGGKDSLASVLDVLDSGVPAEKIVLWHHHVDGTPGQSDGLMDWPVTEGYCRSVAEALGVSIKFSWKDGGFEREMLRENAKTAPTSFETEAGEVMTVGGVRGKDGTRRQFPQVSASLSTRWCSAYLKIDVGRMIFSNDSAYKTGTFLFITGERRQESAARSLYAKVEKHRATNKSRRVDHWRLVIDWKESEVWSIIERHKILPHPAYRLGWGRVSCMSCIFGNADQWASVRELAPEQFTKIVQYEKEFGKTIHRTKSVRELADKGESFIPEDEKLKATALGKAYAEKVIVEDWTMPAGAFKVDGGPQ